MHELVVFLNSVLMGIVLGQLILLIAVLIFIHFKKKKNKNKGDL